MQTAHVNPIILHCEISFGALWNIAGSLYRVENEGRDWGVLSREEICLTKPVRRIIPSLLMGETSLLWYFLKMNKTPGHCPGGYPWEFLVGVCRLFLQILALFPTKQCNFPHPFSGQTSKIHTRFQTWSLGRNYVIITYIRAQTKKFFKTISNSHISLSYWNWNDKHVHTPP